MPITVGIVDDRQLFREGVALLLSTQVELHVVGEAATAEEGLALLSEKQPQVVVLSARERQVFELVVRGHTNGSIAGLLGISAKTVDTHRTKVMRKIGVHSVVDLVRFAARNQLSLD